MLNGAEIKKKVYFYRLSNHELLEDDNVEQSIRNNEKTAWEDIIESVILEDENHSINN